MIEITKAIFHSEGSENLKFIHSNGMNARSIEIFETEIFVRKEN